MEQVHVAVGVVLRDGDTFITQRSVKAHQGGRWEFPGGKCEPGETAKQALARELNEELGITVQDCEPLVQVEHDYGDKQVLLDTYTVHKFSGEPFGREGQPGHWVPLRTLGNYSFPDANQDIIEALKAKSNDL